MSSYRSGGLALFAAAAQFMTVIMLAASMAPAYDYAGGAISDLGVASATAPLFNLSLLLVGILNIVGGVAIYSQGRRRWLLALYLVAGVGAMGAGIFPLDTGAPHALFALLAFVFFNLEAIGSGSITGGAMRWISLVAGVLGLVFVAVMVIGDSGTEAAFGPIGHGGAERMIVYPPMIWMIVFGGYLLGRREAAGETAPAA